MQMGVFFDQSRCTGCFTCVLACKQWHNGTVGSASWRWVVTREGGDFPHPWVRFLSLSCCHCAEPACVAVCPAGAIAKREENGVVIVDQEKCLGKENCGMLCLDACPYEAPRFGTEQNAKMEKCDFCLDRLDQGKQPMCVAACPVRALDAGPLDKLRKKYKGTHEVEGFTYSSKVAPSIIFRQKE